MHIESKLIRMLGIVQAERARIETGWCAATNASPMLTVPLSLAVKMVRQAAEAVDALD